MRRAKKDITQDKKATTQDKKDILGTKRTKQGHSGQKGLRGTFLALYFFPGRAWNLAWSPRARRLTENKTCMKLNLFTNYLSINYYCL